MHFLGMSLRLHLVKHMLDLAVGADDERRPDYAHHLLPVHVLFLDHAKRVAQLLVGIRQQRKRQVKLLLEFLLCLGRVRGCPQQHYASLLDPLVGIAELAGFLGAAGSVGARVEIQNHAFCL